MVLKGCFYVEAYLFRVYKSSIFGVRAVFGMNANHIFPQSMLVIIILIGNVICVVMSRACTGTWVGISLCSCGCTTLLVLGPAPLFLEYNP